MPAHFGLFLRKKSLYLVYVCSTLISLLSRIKTFDKLKTSLFFFFALSIFLFILDHLLYVLAKIF